MKNKLKQITIIFVVLILTVTICFCLYYIADDILNGSFVDWFEDNYIITEYKYSSEVGDFAVVRSPYWPNLKRLLLAAFIVNSVIWVSIVFIISYLTQKRRCNRTISEISKGIRVYMSGDGDIISAFPQKYSEISAQISDIKSTLLQNESTLKEENAKRSDIVAYLAHDLKTPLTSVIGYLSLLSEASDMPEEQKSKYLHIALNKAYRLETMINEFFEITRYNQQNITISKETIDLYYMLLQISDELMPVLSAKGNTVVIKANENLTVLGDPDKLARVFNNILKNASAYSFSNTEIVISARELEDSVMISFTNKGRCIPKEKLLTVFEKFYRLDEARTSNTGGAGLGLAIAKEIVTLHGGSISAYSQNDTVTFQIILPTS